MHAQVLSVHVPEATREEDDAAAALPRPLRGALRVSVANASGPGGLAFLGSSAPGVLAVAQVRSRRGGEVSQPSIETTAMTPHPPLRLTGRRARSGGAP